MQLITAPTAAGTWGAGHAVRGRSLAEKSGGDGGACYGSQWGTRAAHLDDLSVF